MALLAACGSGGDGGPATPTAPVITAQPADVQVTAGAAASFSVSAEGADLRYQWQRSNDAGASWAAVADATTPGLTLATTNTADSGSRFRVLVSRGSAATTSSTATLTVLAATVAPAITLPPQAAQAFEGGEASFAVTATGTSLSYTWQTRRSGADWVTVPQASQPTLRLTGLVLADDQLAVRVTVTNSAASVTAEPVLLTVLQQPAAPTFTTHPANLAVTAPQDATFGVVVLGSPAPTLQWQRGSNPAQFTDIAGATGSSYTLSPTSTGDNAAFFRVVARNASGSVNSASAQLVVSAAPALPGIRTQPADLTVAVGAPASFSVVATGTPQPTLQWQVSTDNGATFANVNGATGSSLGFTATTADDGRLYRAVLSNSVGSVHSNAARLTVLTGAWSAGTPLESGDGVVTVQASAIDDQGRTTVIFGKLDGARVALFATRGLPATGGNPPVWSTPVVIDANAPFDHRDEMALVASPGGNLLASWNRRAPCTATTYETSGTCNYLYTARYTAASGTWQAPMLVSDTRLPGFNARINDNGDVVGVYSAWDSNNAYLPSLAWLPGSQAAYQRRVYNQAVDGFAPTVAVVDGAGRFYAFGNGVNSSTFTADTVVLHGDMTNGPGARQVLASYARAVAVSRAWASPQGAVAAIWQDSNAATSALRVAGHVATLDAAGGSWTTTATGLPFDTGYASTATLTDDGSFVAHALARCASLRRTGGTWAETALPAALCSSVATGAQTTALARNGDFLVLDRRSATLGRWLTYDNRLQQQSRAFTSSASGAGYVLGLPALPAGTVLLAPGGFGAYVSVNSFDTLPSLALPAGSSRGIDSLWAWLLR